MKFGMKADARWLLVDVYGSLWITRSGLRCPVRRLNPQASLFRATVTHGSKKTFFINELATGKNYAAAFKGMTSEPLASAPSM